MRIRNRCLRDFKKRNRPQLNEDVWYDVDLDAVLIEQSIAKQYGILPAMQGELPYSEWAKLVSGLMDDTPLGRVVSTRMEKDRKIIAQMTPWQRAVRSEWQSFRAKKLAIQTKPEEARAQMARLETMIARMFGGEGKA